jgi:5-methylcytosine-specific restriction endonuclease McrA
MNTVANKLICLNLNANWQPVGFKTVKDAIVDLCGAESNGKPSTMALDIEYELDENGQPIFDEAKSMNPVSWEEWMMLPIRPWDLTINSPTRSIRVPTVIIATNFNKMPIKTFKGKPSKDGIWNRDQGICQYTGKKLSKDQSTIDHVIPRSKGGLDTWTNMVVCDKTLNAKKGNKLNSELGLKLRKEPIEPSPTPVSALIREAKHHTWKHFLTIQ